VYYTAAQPINAHTDPGPGKYITIATWGSSGQQAHTMMSIMGQYFESGGGPKGPHRDSGWSQKFDQYRHPAGYAYGGIIDKSDPIRSRHNLLSNTTGGPGSPGYQPTPSEAAAIQRNQMAIKALFAKQHGRAMGGRIDSIEDLLTEQDWRRDGSRKRNVARALGGMVPWFANGADFVAKRPQIIGVGDAPGGERVTVTPQGQGGIGGNVHVEIHNIQVHRKGDVQKIVDEEMRMLAAGLQARM
jgi:hypothetical protein